jgi:non-heme chloroperoxidase
MYYVAVDQNIRCAVSDLNPRGRRCLVFVHAWPLESSLYEWQYTVLPSYGIRCVGIDLRGFGASDKPWGGYSYNRLADDLCRVLNRLELPNAVLCGFSMGACVCIRYMARHKGLRVNRLVLCSTAGPSFVQRAGYPYGMTREQVDSALASLYSDRYTLYESFLCRCFASPPPEALLRHLQRLCSSGAQWASIKTLESMRDEDLRGDLGKICVPTAILHGVQDQICPFPFAEELHNGIRDSFVVPFRQSGHCPFYEEKDAFNSALIDFVNSYSK